MSINWYFKNEVGSYVVHQFVQSKDKYLSFKVGMFGGNCLAANVYRFKNDKGEKHYILQGFFNSITHLHNCLNDYKDKKGTLYPTKKQVNLLEHEEYITNVKINLYAPSKEEQKERLKMAQEFVKAGHEVTLYYKKY